MSSGDFPRRVEVVIVGAGFAGLGMAIQLKRAGRNDFVLLERSVSVGGTWRDNRYPGCACDIPSLVYSFSFEPNPSWSCEYPSQPEMLRYLQYCVEKYRLAPHLRLSCGLRRARFDEAAQSWLIGTENGAEFEAKVLVSGLGPLHRPALPDLQGLDRFEGRMFHSAQWDPDHALAGRQVAVIGTGASAIQLIPAIAGEVGRLSVFQRSAPWVAPKRNPAVPIATQRRYAAHPWLRKVARLAVFWRFESRLLGLRWGWLRRRTERFLESYRQRRLQDPFLRARATPNYALGCKRVLLSSDYYPALARSNVELVTSQIAEVRAHGIVDQEGREHAVDTIIFATGFRAQQPLPEGLIVGRGGHDLATVWQKLPEAYRGTTVAGFPNLFVLLGPGTGLGHNSVIAMIEPQTRYILRCLAQLERRRAASMEIREAAQRDYNLALQARLKQSVWATGGCHSWYQDARGQVTRLWPGFVFSFAISMWRLKVADYHFVAELPRER